MTETTNTCPLCREAVDELEFHHWDYETDVGIRLCRDCHNEIHGGAEGRVAIQQNRAEYYDAETWHVPAIRNLVYWDLQHLPVEEFDVEASESFAEYWAYVRDRYNLPPDDELGADPGYVKREPKSAYRRAKHDPNLDQNERW